MSREPGFHKAASFLHDMALRLYLVGSNRDRQMLQPICKFYMENKFEWPSDLERFSGTPDSQAVVQAYVGLSKIWRQDRACIGSVSLDFLAQIIDWSNDAWGYSYGATSYELLAILRTGLQLMWLVFEYYGRFPAAIHPKVLTGRFKVISSGMLQLSVEKRLYAEMFADEEGVSLLARVLLLITDEGNELEVLDKQDDVAEVYEAMATVTDVLVPAAPGHFLESSADWAKVARHLTHPTIRLVTTALILGASNWPRLNQQVWFATCVSNVNRLHIVIQGANARESSHAISKYRTQPD
ncbi:hypothetical protein FRC09_007537 [Ceratobasidium sp. 395]|nr:hypothetical protein FRC09_007537 [Ceratobasidium sp. 395]